MTAEEGSGTESIPTDFNEIDCTLGGTGGAEPSLGRTEEETSGLMDGRGVAASDSAVSCSCAAVEICGKRALPEVTKSG